MTLCPVCGMELKRLTKKHCKRHGLTLIEMYEKYPILLEGKRWDLETLKKMSLCKRGESPVKGRPSPLRGRTLTEEHKKKNSIANTGENNGFARAYKNYTEEQKEEFVKNGGGGWNKGIPSSIETRKKQSESRIGEKNPMYGKQRKRISKRSYIVSNRFGTFKVRSTYEVKAFDLLANSVKVLKVDYESFTIPYIGLEGQQRTVCPDFFIMMLDGTKKVIEVKDKRRLRFKDQSIKVEATKRFCEEKGYVFELWDQDILFNGDKYQEHLYRKGLKNNEGNQKN